MINHMNDTKKKYMDDSQKIYSQTSLLCYSLCNSFFSTVTVVFPMRALMRTVHSLESSTCSRVKAVRTLRFSQFSVHIESGRARYVIITCVLLQTGIGVAQRVLKPVQRCPRQRIERERCHRTKAASGRPLKDEISRLLYFTRFLRIKFNTFQLIPTCFLHAATSPRRRSLRIFVVT